MDRVWGTHIAAVDLERSANTELCCDVYGHEIICGPLAVDALLQSDHNSCWGAEMPLVYHLRAACATINHLDTHNVFETALKPGACASTVT